MAFAVQSIGITVTVEDDSGTQATTEVFFDPTIVANQNFASLQAFAADFAAGVAGISTGRVNRYSVNILAYDAAATAAAADSNVERKGVFILEGGGGEIVTYQIPSIDDALVDTSDTITLTAPAVATLVNLYENGDGTIQPATVRRNAIIRVKEAFQRHQKSHLTTRRRQG